MYAPYTLSLTLVCFYLLFHIDRIRETSPFSIIWLKVAFMSLYVYSLSIPGVTVRLSELLSIVHVFLIPLLVDAVPSKYRMCGGVSAIILGILILTNFIFFQHFIEIT